VQFVPNYSISNFFQPKRVIAPIDQSDHFDARFRRIIKWKSLISGPEIRAIERCIARIAAD
jgi:hypothetical protein